MGACLAEVIRGGLQAVPRGQHEAADALGLSYWRKHRLIILPQAIRHVIPPLVNTFTCNVALQPSSRDADWREIRQEISQTKVGKLKSQRRLRICNRIGKIFLRFRHIVGAPATIVDRRTAQAF